MKNQLNILVYTLALTSIVLISCQKDRTYWEHVNTIKLGKTTPIGIATIGDHLWVSDGDNNKLIHLNKLGKIINTIDGFERPMHIASFENAIYVPEYGKDQITIVKPSGNSRLEGLTELDAPAGIDINKTEIAIADFYNHRILYSTDGTTWKSFGQEGKANGEFYYPTDVKITNEAIYVADAYNNRVQVFDKELEFIQTMGEDLGINAATGIEVSENYIYLTDFENDRLIIFNKTGAVQQIIENNLGKPTDILSHNDSIFVTNYGSKSLSIFKEIKN